MKKFISFVLTIGCMLNFSTFAHAESSLAIYDETNARLISMFQDTSESWYSSRTVCAIKSLTDFAGNSYTIAEYAPAGYAIYNNSSALILEKSENSPSPYEGLSTNLYYAGPTFYYFYNEDSGEFIHTISGEILENQAAEARANICMSAQAKWNQSINTSLKTYIESGIIGNNISNPLSSNSYTYVGNHGYFFEDLTTADMMGYYDDNEDGCCSYVAAGLVLLYYDYYFDDDIIDNDTYLSSSGDSFVGEDFTEHLYRDIGIETLGYDNGINARETAIVMRTYLDDERDILISFWSLYSPSIANIISQLEEDRPVIYTDRWDNPQPSGGKTNHTIVIYGYDNNDNLIAHFGWEDYSHVECTSGAFELFISSASAINSYD